MQVRVRVYSSETLEREKATEKSERVKEGVMRGMKERKREHDRGRIEKSSTQQPQTHRPYHRTRPNPRPCSSSKGSTSTSTGGGGAATCSIKGGIGDFGFDGNEGCFKHSCRMRRAGDGHC